MNTDAENYFIDGCGRCSKGGTPDCKVRLWSRELELMRSIALECGLDETSKWGHPTYMFKKHNILLIHCFKDYAAFAFMKGSLLKDEANILIQQTENVQSTRQIRFTNTKEITEKRDVIKAYIFEAIENEKAGLKVEMKKTEEFEFPLELNEIFVEQPDYKTAFEALTPGRQRGYLLHFSQAKQASTRRSRIEKCKSKVLAGKGWNER